MAQQIRLEPIQKSNPSTARSNPSFLGSQREDASGRVMHHHVSIQCSIVYASHAVRCLHGRLYICIAILACLLLILFPELPFFATIPRCCSTPLFRGDFPLRCKGTREVHVADLTSTQLKILQVQSFVSSGILMSMTNRRVKKCFSWRW
jgi:hypothetical protein